MGDYDDKEVQWSSLPKDVIAILIKRLETRIDFLRCRSVCRSWRSSFSASPPPPPLSLHKFPFPFFPPAGDSRHGNFTAAETTIFRLQPLDENPNRTSCYLIKVEEDKHGKMRLVCPLSDQALTRLPERFPKALNLSEFRISELHKSYTFRNLELVNHKPIEAGLPFVKKMVVLASNPESTIVVVVYEMWDMDGRLAMLRVGDESWTPIHMLQLVCADVIVYNGSFYMVDRSGRAFLLDPNMRLVEIAPPPAPPNENGKKHLVESLGDLLMVDKYFKLHDRSVYYYRDGKERVKSSNREMVSEMRVYRLNEDEHRWVEVRSLEDQILFVGEDCSFSVSAREFPGCRGNRVLYEDHAVASQIEHEDEVFDGLWVYQTGVFNLGNGRVRSLATSPQLARIFWPPPSSSGCSVAENTDLKAKAEKGTISGNPTSSPSGGTLLAMSSSGSSTFGLSASATSSAGNLSQGSPFGTSSGSFFSTQVSSAPSPVFGTFGTLSFTSSSSLFGSSTPSKVVGSITSFGPNSSATSSETNSIVSNPTSSSIFSSTWQPAESSILTSLFVSPSSALLPFSVSIAATSSAPTVFGSFTATSSTSTRATASTSQAQPGFSSSIPVFMAASGNSDQANMEDSIAKDNPVQASTPAVQPSVLPSSGFTFSTPASSAKNPFQFDGQQNQSTPQNSSQFQASIGRLDFSSGGGSFRLSSGGSDKSNRKFVKVKHKNRRRQNITKSQVGE